MFAPLERTGMVIKVSLRLVSRRSVIPHRELGVTMDPELCCCPAVLFRTSNLFFGKGGAFGKQ